MHFGCLIESLLVPNHSLGNVSNEDPNKFLIITYIYPKKLYFLSRSIEKAKLPLLTKYRTIAIDFQLVIYFSTLYRARNIYFL